MKLILFIYINGVICYINLYVVKEWLGAHREMECNTSR